MTFDPSQLGYGHLEQLNIASSSFDRIHIAGGEKDGPLQRLVKTGCAYNHSEIEAELVAKARDLIKQHPEIGAMVLECTQMPPFAEAIQSALGGIPVYDVYTLGLWFYDGLVRRSPRQWGQTLQ